MAASEDLQDIQELLDDPAVRAAGKTMFRGKEVTIAELVKLRNETQTLVNAEQSKAAASYPAALRERTAVKETATEKRILVRNLEKLVEDANGLLTVAIDRNKDIEGAQANLVSAIDRLRSVDPQNKLLPPAPEETEPAMGQPIKGDKVVGTLTLEQTRALQNKPDTVDVAKTDKKTGTTVTPPTGVVTQDKVVSQLEVRGLPDTPENRKTIRKELAKKAPLSGDWKERLIAQYPQYEAYLTNPEFGEDVSAVFQRAMEEEWFKYGDTGQAVFSRELAKTVYGRRTNATQQTFDGKKVADQAKLIETAISDYKSQYGNLGLSDEQLYNLGKETARNGYNDDQKRRAIFNMAYSADQGADRDAVIARIDAGKFGQEVRTIYAGNLLKTPEDAIQRYTTGQITLDDVKREARETAAGFYPGLKALIDQGVSVKSVADQYAGLAADILEQPQTTINMTDPKFRAAFDVRDNGVSRVMTGSEWQTLLKSNPDFGWQYTKTANNQALETAAMISRAFGKVI
jgi:hypothetical protein